MSKQMGSDISRTFWRHLQGGVGGFHFFIEFVGGKKPAPKFLGSRQKIQYPLTFCLFEYLLGRGAVVVTAYVPDPVIFRNLVKHREKIVLVAIAVAPIIETVPIEIILVALNPKLEDIRESLVVIEEGLLRERRWLTVAKVARVRANPSYAIVVQDLQDIRSINQASVVTPGTGQSTALDTQHIADQVLGLCDFITDFVNAATCIEKVRR